MRVLRFAVCCISKTIGPHQRGKDIEIKVTNKIYYAYFFVFSRHVQFKDIQ